MRARDLDHVVLFGLSLGGIIRGVTVESVKFFALVVGHDGLVLGILLGDQDLPLHAHVVLLLGLSHGGQRPPLEASLVGGSFAVGVPVYVATDGKILAGGDDGGLGADTTQGWPRLSLPLVFVVLLVETPILGLFGR